MAPGPTAAAGTASSALLQAAGYTVDVPPNPLQGLPYDSAFLTDFLHSISGPIMLVGHSYGGAVITNAATGDSAGQGPGLRRRLRARAGPDHRPAARRLPRVVRRARQPDGGPVPRCPAGVGDAYIKQSVFPSCMANGLPAAEAEVLAATQRPLATIALTQPTGVPAWQTIPSWAVVGTADHAIPPALQLAMAENAHAHITEINAPHLSMISDPGVVTSVILQAIHATT